MQPRLEKDVWVIPSNPPQNRRQLNRTSTHLSCSDDLAVTVWGFLGLASTEVHPTHHKVGISSKNARVSLLHLNANAGGKDSLVLCISITASFFDVDRSFYRQKHPNLICEQICIPQLMDSCAPEANANCDPVSLKCWEHLLKSDPKKPLKNTNQIVLVAAFRSPWHFERKAAV